MKLREITNYLESIAPIALQESYDNSGLLVGNPDQEVSNALLTLDCTEAVIDEAVAMKCNLVIAHHPIIFSGLKKLNGKNYVERTVIKAIKNDVAIYAIHTNLDNVAQGVNRKIAEKLGLRNCQVLEPKTGMLIKLAVFVPRGHAENVRAAMFKAGAGQIGNYDECSFNMDGEGTFRGSENSNPFVGTKGQRHTEHETRIEVILPAWKSDHVVAAMIESHPYEEVAYDLYPLSNSYRSAGSGMIGQLDNPVEAMVFLKMLKEKMNATAIRYTTIHKNEISRVAVCGGSGSFLLAKAIAAKADVFITADFKYHQFFDADGQIIIADIGHFESEQFTPQLLGEMLALNFPTFATHFSRVNTNPINYL